MIRAADISSDGARLILVTMALSVLLVDSVALGETTVHVPTHWNPSPLAAEDEGLWFVGDDLLRPDVAFQLVRDTPLESLLRGGAVRQQGEVKIGEVAATQ